MSNDKHKSPISLAIEYALKVNELHRNKPVRTVGKDEDLDTFLMGKAQTSAWQQELDNLIDIARLWNEIASNETNRYLNVRDLMEAED
jgi:hypothetical protein